MAGDADGDVVVPPTLRALLGARLDQLDASERSVLERAAVEGEVFHRGAVQALTPGDTTVTPRLAALVRRKLIGPERPQSPARTRSASATCSSATPPTTPCPRQRGLTSISASPHGWSQQGADLVELDEIVGYHLEQALHYQAELGLARDEAVTAAAVRHLSAAGGRANDRGDPEAAASLLARAVAMLPPGQIDLAAETNLIDALLWAARRTRRSEARSR